MEDNCNSTITVVYFKIRTYQGRYLLCWTTCFFLKAIIDSFIVNLPRMCDVYTFHHLQQANQRHIYNSVRKCTLFTAFEVFWMNKDITQKPDFLQLSNFVDISQSFQSSLIFQKSFKSLSKVFKVFDSLSKVSQ